MTKKNLLLMVRTNGPAEGEEKWNAWYNTHHVANRLNIPGFISVRRYIAIDGEPKYITLYEIENIDVLTSEPYLKLREWEASLSPQTFEAITQKLPDFSRGLYRQIYPA